MGPHPDETARIAAVQSYYARILPFYEKESLSQTHLDFWREIARQRRPRRILEIGSGLGRITSELARIAPSVGIDVSLTMLAAASRRSRRASPRGAARPLLVAADAHRAVFRSTFDLIVAPGDPISHMRTIDGRKRTLRAIARQLSGAGVFVLEGLYRRRREIALPRRTIPYAGGVLYVDETWVPVGAGQLWHARYRYVDDRRGGPSRTATAWFLARSWNPATIRGLFRSCGLEIVELWGDFDRRPFRSASSRILVVARRRDQVSSALAAGRVSRPDPAAPRPGAGRPG